MNVRDRNHEVLYSIGESIFNVYKFMELVVYIGYAAVMLGIFVGLIPFFVLYWALRKKRNFRMITSEELSIILVLSFIGWGVDIFRGRDLFFEQIESLILSSTSIFLLLFFGGLLVLYLKRKLLSRSSKK